MLFFWGLALVPLAQAIALAFIAPLIALFLAAIFLGETIGPRAIIASLIALGGVAIIFVGQAQADLGDEAVRGSIAILASAVCYAVNIILMRRQALVAKPIEIAFFQNLIVAILLLAAWPFVGGADFPPSAQIPFVLLRLLSTASLLLLAWPMPGPEASYLAATELRIPGPCCSLLVFGETSPFSLGGRALSSRMLLCGRPAIALPASQPPLRIVMAWLYLIVAAFRIRLHPRCVPSRFRTCPDTCRSGLVDRSMACSNSATRSIPMGTAYAVWGGIGAVGTVAVGMAFYAEPTTTIRLLLILAIVAAIAALKLTA